jgi:hypothetical protein
MQPYAALNDVSNLTMPSKSSEPINVLEKAAD